MTADNSNGIHKKGELGRFTVYKDTTPNVPELMGYKGECQMMPISEDNMYVPYAQEIVIDPVPVKGENAKITSFSPDVSPYIPAPMPTLADETRNKLVELARERVKETGKHCEIWIWSIESPDKCAFDLVDAGDTEALYSQSPTTYLLDTVKPIPAPIYQPIQGK